MTLPSVHSSLDKQQQQREW